MIAWCNAVLRCCTVLWFFEITYGFLNIEELTNAKYALQILNDPLNENDVDLKSGLMLASRHGQNYYCTLPEPFTKSSDAEQDKIPKSTPVSTLLEPLRGQDCMKIIKGWWTYEFCYGKHVLQYHTGTNGVKGDVTHLGFYESDFDWNKEALEETINVKRHKINRYHSQTYINGTSCDIIHHNRDTEVRFFCSESSLETYIERVDEPSTCSYILTIMTPYICAHPRTRPILKPKPVDIACQPVLASKTYVVYEEMVLAKKREAEIKALREIEHQKLMLHKMLGLPTPLDMEKQDQIGGSEIEQLTSVDYQKSLNAFYREFAKKLIEIFIDKEQLYNMDSFKQIRLAMDVSDLMKIHKDAPTADQARIIQGYVHRFAGANAITGLFDVMNSGENAIGDMKDNSNTAQLKRPVKVQLKFHKIKSMDKLKDLTSSASAEEDESSVDPIWKKLEDDISQGLEDAGFQSEDSSFEIRVISTDDSITDGINLSPEEGEKFRQMLMELVSGSTAMTREAERQRSLNDNYNIVWKEESASFASLNQDNEENEDIKSYQL